MKQNLLFNQASALGKRLALVLTMLLTVGIGQAWGADPTATLSFAYKAQRTSFSNTKQVWEQNGVTFTNDKASSSNAVADYAAPVRLYAGSSVTVACSLGNMKKIVFDCNSSSYATAMKNSIGSSATASSDKVTVALDEPSNTFSVAKLTAQVRIDAITVTYEEEVTCKEIAPSLTYSPTTLEIGSTANPTLTDNTGDGTVTYSSDDSSVASVNATTGVVTANAVGTATITATIAANGDYCGGVTTATIKVNEQSATIVLSEAGTENTVSGTFHKDESYTLPSSTEAKCGDKVLVGWSTIEIAETDTKPTSNYYDKGTSVSLKAGENKFYAVFATKSETTGGTTTTPTTATLSFASTAQRTTLTTSQQVWTQNGITLTNNKGSSTSNVADYSNPARFYKSSNIIVEAPGNITKIVFNCVKDYVISITGATTSGYNVTVSLDGTSGTYTVNTLSAQVRMNSLEVTYNKTTTGGTTITYSDYTTSCITETVVTLNPNEGAFATDPEGWTKDGDNYKKEGVTGAITLPIPTRTGYDFDGWYDGETKVNSPYTPSETVTLIAKWVAKQTQLSINVNTANHGSGSDFIVLATYGEALPNFDPCTPATGYTLNGYYTGATGGTKIIDKDGKLVSNISDYTSADGKWASEAEQLILYAQYIINTYTVTFDNQGHGTKPDNQTINHGGKVNNPGNLTENGFIFGGWYKESRCTNAWNFETDVVTSNITIYAKWTAKTATSLTWSAATYVATIDADNDFPELTKSPADLSPIAYSSSNTGVATIDANGNITLVAAGTTTITATFTETATHTGAKASYTLTVYPSNCRWVEVTDNTTLKDGDEVVITMTNILAKTFALPNDIKTDAVPNAIGLTINNNHITSVSNELIWIIGKDGENLTFESYTERGNFLRCNNADDGVRIDDTANANRKFVVDDTYNYLKNTQTTKPRYLGVHSDKSQWYSYALTNMGNFPTKIVGQTLKFYKRECLDVTKVWVEGNLTNVTCDQTLPQQLAKNGSLTLKFEAATGYALPDNVTVTGATPSWNKATGTLTISNPTANVTITIEAVKLHTINWMVGSSSVLTEDVANGTGVTQTPASNPEGDAIGDCADTFLGWSEESAGSTPQNAAYYDDLCTAAQMKAKHTSVTEDKTFYAVFATKEGSSETIQMYKLVTNISGGKEYIFATGNSAGSVYGLTCDANSNLTATSLTVITSSGITYIETPASNNVVWNITSSNSAYNAQNKGQSGKYLRCYGTAPNAVIAASAYALYWDGSKGLYGKSNSGNTSYYLYYDTNASKWGASNSPSGRVYAFEKTEVTVDNTTYSNYVTNCCALAPATNLTVSGTTSNTATLTWTAPSPTTGITKLQVRNAADDAVVVDDIAVGTTTATITGLTECTKYNYYVASVGDCEVFSNTVTAQPFSNAKTVNYDYNDGSGSPASFTTSCENQVITLPTATRAGYDFNGWYTAATGGTKVGDAGDTYNPTTSSITLYAQWTKKIYVISFHANGGEGTMANQSADENDVVAQLNANQFTRDGYAFVGWNTTAGGTGTAYADQATNITLTGNLTLYAQWAAIVTLNDAGNVTTTHPTTVNGTITLPNGANACDPYEFVGWTTDATGDWNEGINEPALVATTYTPNAPTTLYAVYRIQSEGNANAFKLSFEGSNGNTYYVDEYSTSPLRGYSNITKDDAVTFIKTKMYPNDDTRYYLYMEEKGEYLYYNGYFNTTSNTPSESQGWIIHTVGDKIKLQSTYSYDPKYLSFSDRDNYAINIDVNASGSEFNMLSAVTSTYVASPLCNQKIEIIYKTGNGNFVDNAPDTNPFTVSRGDVITLPTCEYPGYEFMGWLKDEQQLDPSDIIGTYYTGDYTVDGVSSTITFYAYYKVIPEEVEFTGKDDAELLMYYYDGTANYYYAVSHAAERGELSSKQNCFNATTWTFTNVGNMQYHIQDETGKYLGAYSDGDNDLILSATPKVWTFTEVNGLWKMVCENSPSRALMYISTGKRFTNAAISNEGNGVYSYVTLGICPYPTYTTNPVLTQGFVVTNTAMVTSAVDQKVKAASTLTLETRNIELPCTFTIAAPNITFYDNTGAEVTQLTASAASEQFELHFAYKPTAENTMEYPTITIVDDEMKTYTIKNRIYARSLPNTFAIVAKVGGIWYALPSQGLNSTDALVGYPVEVDNLADPTAVTAVPANADWSLRQVYASTGNLDRFKTGGHNLVFVNNVSPEKALNPSSSSNYLLTNAQYNNYHNATTPGLYEWTPTTTDLETYQLTNVSRIDKQLNIATNTVFGVHATEVVTADVRFLPIQNRYTPMAAQVVEWKDNSVVVMYNGDPAQTASVSVNGGSAQTTTLSSAQKDIAVYELTANGLATNPTQSLSITIGTEKAILPIPYIIGSATDDATILGSGSVAAKKEIAKVADLVVLNGGKLTANGAASGPFKFRNVTIYGGGKLVIPSDKGFGVASLTLRAGGITDAGEYDYVYPQFELRGTFTNSTSGFYYDYITDYDDWYHLVLPFAGELGSITYPTEFYGANVTAGNKGSWVIKRYAGEIRATGNYNAWKDIETEGETSTIAGKGYIFWGAPKKVTVNGATARQKWGIQRITMPITAGDAIDAENDKEGGKTISDLGSYEDIANNSGKPNDQGWNLIGNPYMVDLTNMSTSGLHACKLVEVIDPATGKWNGQWEWNDDTNIRYLTIPSEHFDTYTAKTVTQAVPLVPGRAFFVQLEGEANGVTFSAANRASLMPQHLAAQNTAVEVETGIVLSNETMQDEVNFWIKDGKTNDYEYNADYPKTPNNNQFNIYGVHTNGDLSWVATGPEYAAESMPIGYQVPAAGTYMLSLSEIYNSDGLDALYVTDHALSPEVTVDIMSEPYEFSVNQAETNNERFTVSVRVKAKTENGATGLGNVGADGEQIHKFIYQDKMYILHHGVIYDATGKRVITINK